MHTDHAVLTGSRHTGQALPCQDYCLSEAQGDTAWALVADGCSTGGETDLGARAWALAARQLLREHPAPLPAAEFEQRILKAAGPALAALEPADGYATLVFVQTHEGQVQATFFGDGALLARHADGSRTLINLRYTDNAPYYLNYAREPHTVNEWAWQFAGQERVVTTNRYDECGELVSVGVDACLASGGAWTWTADANDLELVLVATDGVDSRGPGFIAGAKELLDVKSHTGDFLKRRVSKLCRQWTGAGTLPEDDLAVAGIWLGKVPAAQAAHG